MLMHFRWPQIGGPLCLGDKHKHDAVMMTNEIDKVTCGECQSLYYQTGKELGITGATIDLWIDGPAIGESAGWRQPVEIDWDRFTSDDAFAKYVSEHVTQVLVHLAAEIKEIGMQVPLPVDIPE